MMLEISLELKRSCKQGNGQDAVQLNKIFS